MHCLLFIFVLLFSMKLCLGQSKSCYNFETLGGSSESDSFPCDPYANVSACCPSNSVCATNLYCAFNTSGGPGPTNFIGFVGTCTDITWKDPACPFVLNTETEFDLFNYTLNTTQCDNDADEYCPGPGNTDCCYEDQGKPEITFENDKAVPSTAADLSTYYAAGTYTASATALQTTSGGASSQTAMSSLTGSSPTSTPSPITAQPGNTAKAGLHPSASAGIGVGVGVGCCAAAGLLYFLIKRRTTRRQEGYGGSRTTTTQSEPSQTANSSGEMQDEASSQKLGFERGLAGMEMDATPVDRVSEMSAIENPPYYLNNH